MVDIRVRAALYLLCVPFSAHTVLMAHQCGLLLSNGCMLEARPGQAMGKSCCHDDAEQGAAAI